MKHSQLITLLHRQHAIAREIHWLVDAQASGYAGWQHPLKALRLVASFPRLSQEADLLEALLAVQMVARLKAELLWARRHQAGQAIHPEGRWQ